jgi:glycerophosphoryl diester phosphodiesterase
MSANELRLYGHRGASACEPENTLPAFERALADGANALELDIHRTADGHFVVAHDPDGRRTAGTPDLIRNLTLAEVKRWRLQHRLGAGCVPTLEEVLQTFPGIPTSIDLKPDAPHMVVDLLDLLDRCNATATATLASFSTRVVNRIRALGYPGPTALTRPEVALLRFLPTRLTRRHIRGLAAHVPLRSGPVRLDVRSFLARCHHLGLRADFWVVNDPQRAQQLLEAGATGIMTDDPASLAPVFRQRAAVPARID